VAGLSVDLGDKARVRDALKEGMPGGIRGDRLDNGEVYFRRDGYGGPVTFYTLAENGHLVRYDDPDSGVYGIFRIKTAENKHYVWEVINLQDMYDLTTGWLKVSGEFEFPLYKGGTQTLRAGRRYRSLLSERDQYNYRKMEYLGQRGLDTSFTVLYL
jgi:hypothetical protein